MATFFIPGDVITSVGTFGGGAPETGYYSATIKSLEPHPTKPTSRRMTVVFENGFSTLSWLNSAYDKDGNVLPGLSENQIMGMTKAVKTVFVSAGFTNEQMAEGVTDDWHVGATVHLEWHAGKDLGAQYGEIAGFITKDRFDNFRANNTKPACYGAGNDVKAAVATSTTAPAPNGVGGPKLPPPPSATQTIAQ